MTASVLISGRLHRPAERKMSRAMKPFVSAVLRVADGDHTTWWQVLCFSESAGDELMSLQAGEGVAVSGSFKAEVYTAKDGSQKVGFTVFCDAAISARRRKRERAQERKAERAAEPAESQASTEAAFNDPVPF